MRKKSKYPGLEKRYALKIRQELIDQDYIHKLSEEEKKYLSDFNEEWVAASFKHDGKVLHDSEELKKECRRKNYTRNNDTYDIKKTEGMLDNIDDLANRSLSTKDSVEDSLIKMLDNPEFLKRKNNRKKS